MISQICYLFINIEKIYFGQWMAFKKDLGPTQNADALMYLYKTYEENGILVKNPLFESMWLELEKKKNGFESLTVILKDNNTVILWETKNYCALKVA